MEGKSKAWLENYAAHMQDVMQDPKEIRRVPVKYLTEEICIAAIEGNPYIIDKIRKFKRTPAVFLAMIKRGGMLGHVPRSMRTAEMCLIAVKTRWGSFTEVPPEVMNEEICMEIVKMYAPDLERIPVQFRTYKVCLEAVRKIGSTIKHVPLEILTEEMCIEAIKSFPLLAFARIPDNFKTPPVVELYNSLVSQPSLLKPREHED